MDAIRRRSVTLPDENITFEYGVLAGYGGDFVVCWQSMDPRAVPVVPPAHGLDKIKSGFTKRRDGQ